ncbi:MAG: exodeoxyribonuclease VII small subunit [Chlamydiota bacterium]|jgi:exodeoxyribonuclease VII small subunit
MDNQLTYEKAFERLEKILTTLNEGKASLEDSLKLFEEANQLINSCSSKLTMAEKKIETLIKARDGSLQLDDNGQPLKETFEPESKDLFSKKELT